MATLDEIRLQQLLAPFNNQTGVMSSSQAVPMINSIPMINTGMIDQRLQNTDLVNQIIERNRIANMNKFANTVAPLGNTQQIPLLDNTQQIPTQNFEFLSSAYEDDDAEQVESLTQESSGIAKLFELLRNIPTPFNLARRGLEALRGSEGLSDFRNARTGAEFFKTRRDREALARDPNVFKDARNITSNLRRTAADNIIDRGRGQSFSAPTRSAPTRSAAATRSRDLGSMRGGVGR